MVLCLPICGSAILYYFAELNFAFEGKFAKINSAWIYSASINSLKVLTRQEIL